MGARFEPSSRTEVLERLFRETTPRKLTAKLEGPAVAMAKSVVMVTFQGRLVEASAGIRTGIEALTVLALSDGGEIDAVAIAPPAREPARFPEGLGLYRQAAANATEIAALLAPLGGLSALLSADLDRFVEQIAQVPDAANVVLRMVDGQSTVADILSRSPHDLRLTARILHRLMVSEIVLPLAPPAPASPASPASSSSSEVGAPAADDMEGEAVNADVKHWLEREAPPPPLMSQDAFTSAFTRTSPERTMTPRPGTRAPLPDRPEPPLRLRRNEEEEFFREAGVGRTGLVTWVGLGFAGVLLGVVASFLLGGPPALESIDAGEPIRMLPSPITSTTTATTASSTVALGPDGRPPIAGPDAPEDVKRAERLLNSGRYGEARSLLEQLRVTRAQDPTVWILSGQVEVDVGRLAEADTHADRALELDPKSYRGWVLKGSVLQFRGRFSQAASAYQKALALEPKHPMTAEIQSVLDQMDKDFNK